VVDTFTLECPDVGEEFFIYFYVIKQVFFWWVYRFFWVENTVWKVTVMPPQKTNENVVVKS